MLMPQTEAELAQILKAAAGPVFVQGGGTRGMAVPGVLVKTAGLSGITVYEPGALVMVAGAGTPLAEIEAALAAEGQMLAFEPPDLSTVTGATGASTIGGVFATNASGPRRVAVGAARDFMLGVRFVDGAGNIIKNGGRVMKNVTGYDLVRLMAGSHGTLGVLSEVSFKVLPQPEMQATLVLTGLEIGEAVTGMSAALCSPFAISGAAHRPGPAGRSRTMLRLEGFESSVSYRARKLAELLGPFGAVRVETDQARSAALWREIRECEPLRGKSAQWRVSIRPSEAAAFWSGGPWRDIECDAFVDWGGGLVRISACDDQLMACAEREGVSKDIVLGTKLMHRALQGYVQRVGGHATLVHSCRPTDFPRFQPEPAAVATLSNALRRQFDPRGILNAGLMG